MQVLFQNDRKAVKLNPGIILIGSERSGSNLLRVLLDNHSQVSAPVPVHFCDVFSPLVPTYGPLNNSTNSARLLDHMIEYANSDFSDWKLRKEGADLVSEYRVTSFASAFSAIYSEKARQSGKVAYFCKDNNMHRYAFPLKSQLESIRFIYLYRDPRDQVASWMRNPLFLKTPRKAIRKWVDEQQSIRKLIDVWGLNPVFVKYESLVAEPGRVMRALLEQLELPVEATCFETSGNHFEAKKYKLWKNIEKPVIRDNFGRYLDILSRDDVQVIENQAEIFMKWLGYERTMKPVRNVERSFRYWLHEIGVRYRNEARMRRDTRSGELALLEAKRAVRKKIIGELEANF